MINLADHIGRGLVAGFAGTAAMTISSTLDFEDDRAQARFNDLSHWGYGTGWGVVRGLLSALGLSPRAATLAHGAAVYGAAQVTLPALEIAPPVVFWPKEEIAIDAFHHAVYAAATGGAYALLDGLGR